MSAARVGASRIQSPAPRAKSKADVADTLSLKTASTKADTREDENEKADQNNSMDKGLLVALASIPIAVFSVCAVAASPPVRATLGKICSCVCKAWASISSPFESLLKYHADLLVVLCALAASFPLVLFVAVNCWRAAGDLQHLTTWQKKGLAAVVLSALATLSISEGTLWTFAYFRVMWNSISDPIGDFIHDYSGHLVAASAFCTFAPLAVIALFVIARSFWNLRVRVVIEHGEEGDKNQ